MADLTDADLVAVARATPIHRDICRAVPVAWMRAAIAADRERNTAELDRLRAALDKWETTLSAVMPAEYTDWHESDRAAWPDLAASCIVNARRMAEADGRLIAAMAGKVATWQPIETAPKEDGVHVLLHGSSQSYSDITVIGYWSDFSTAWRLVDSLEDFTPTHWMPLPDEPQQTIGDNHA